MAGRPSSSDPLTPLVVVDRLEVGVVSLEHWVSFVEDLKGMTLDEIHQKSRY